MKKSVTLFLYAFVFATGAAGLIYQVAWQKYLSRLLGSDCVANAIILAVFLGGLSLGYYLCGTMTLRVRSCYKAYALLEGLIGLWAIFFPGFFSAVCLQTRHWSFAPPALIVVQGLFCTVLLTGLPTVCMGGTVPLLTRALSQRIADATRIHAAVYAVNTAGAFIGTLLAGFYLIPAYGLPLTVMATGLINISAALFFYALSAFQRTGSECVPAAGDPEIPQPDQPARLSPRALYLTVFVCGFYAMTLENVLIRFTSLSLGSSSYSFSIVVAVFILAIAGGSAAAGRLRRIGRGALFYNQLCITLLLLGVYVTLDTWPYWAHLIRIAFQPNIAGFRLYYVSIFAVLAAVLLLPAGCMGATLPLAFNERKRALQNVGSHAGSLFSWNTLGNLLGSLTGGILFYYVFNNGQVFLTAVFLAAVTAAVCSRGLPKQYAALSCLAALAALFFIARAPLYNKEHFAAGAFLHHAPLPCSFDGPRAFFDTLSAGMRVLFYEDGPAATVAVVETPAAAPGQKRPLSIFVNGKSDSSTGGDRATLKLLAHLPALFARSRENIMVIGLGTGMTAGEMTLYPDVKHLDIAEISPSVIRALPCFAAFTHAVHTDPRVRIVTGDAFRILGRSSRKWDIISSEPSNPWVAGTDSLFTLEFYRLCREHLTERGVLVQWAHTYFSTPAMLGMILHTAAQVFPHTRAFVGSAGDVLILSTGSSLGREDIERAEQTFAAAGAVRHSLAGINIGSIDDILLRELYPRSYITDRFARSALQTMDNPRLHYIAGEAMFMDHSIPDSFLWSETAAAYVPEFLMAMKYPGWAGGLPFSEAKLHSLAASAGSTGEVKGAGTGVILPALKLKAYLSDPVLFPLAPPEKAALRADAIPFIARDCPDEQAWAALGLKGAAYRTKGEALISHTHLFRNWIVPYPLDGLQALLQRGMAGGKDAYEKNWCALQLALLLAEKQQDAAAVIKVLRQAVKAENGGIILKQEDRALLETVNAYLAQQGERHEDSQPLLQPNG